MLIWLQRILDRVKISPLNIPRRERSSMDPHIFLSYARDDYEHAKKLYDRLTSIGYTVWFDKESLLPGQHWKEAIEAAISNCVIFIPLLSSAAAQKDGFIQEEIGLALERKHSRSARQIFIIPARVDAINAGTYPLFRDLHWADLYSDYDGAIKRLTKFISDAVGIEPRAGELLLNSFGDNLCAYLPLKDDIQDVTGFSERVSIQHEPGSSPSLSHFSTGGLRFDGRFVVQVRNKQIPCRDQPRTFSLWVQFDRNIPRQSASGFDTPKFLFSYGVEEHDRSFGLFYGVPFFDAALGPQYGFRIFTWCHPLLYSLGQTGCDSEPFSTAVLSNWYHLAISFDGKVQKGYVNGELRMSENRPYSTFETTVMNLGGFLPGREFDYHSYLFEGGVREVMMFNRVLSREEIVGVYSATRQRL